MNDRQQLMIKAITHVQAAKSLADEAMAGHDNEESYYTFVRGYLLNLLRPGRFEMTLYSMLEKLNEE